MKKFLFIYAVLTTVIIIFGSRYLLSENSRLQANNQSLMADVDIFRTDAERAAAAVQVLRLKVGEYEELRAADAAKIREMGIKIRRLQSAAKSVTRSEIVVNAPLRDTIIVRDTVHRVDTLRLFRWSDSWVAVDGIIDRDSVQCNVSSIDTLHQMVYRIPRNFLFFRFGTKALRQQIVSSNPHNKIVYTEYIKIEK